MAASIALLTAAGDDSNVGAGGTYSTASITPTANAQVGIALLLTGIVGTPTSVIGNGITYTLVTSITYNTIASPGNALYFYMGSSATPSTGAITITVSANETGATWSVFEITGHDSTTPFPQTPTNRADATTPISVTMGAFVNAQSGTLLLASTDLNNTYTDEAGYASISSTTGSGPSRSLNVSYLGSNDTSPTTTPNSTRDWGAIGVEVAATTSSSPFFTQLDAAYV